MRAGQRMTAAVFGGVLLSTSVQASDASAVLREGDTVPGEATGAPISAINNSAVNHVGGYAFTVNTDDGTLLSHIFGDAAGGVGNLIRTEGTIGDYIQNSFESFFGISDSGSVAYSPSTDQISSGTTGLDAVWTDATPVLVEEDAYTSFPGQFNSFNSRPGMLADGTPFWVGGITDTQGGSSINRAIFVGSESNPILVGGSAIPGVAEPMEEFGSIDFDFRLSKSGTNYINQVIVDATPSDDGVVISNGNALSPGGGIMREGSPVPASVGGLPGENYDNFDFFGITESGSYLVTGDTDGDTASDEFIMVDGQIVMREGDLAGGFNTSGSIEGAYLNEDGDWAAIWDVDGPNGNVEALIVNGVLLLMEGDAVDWNNDGVIDGADGNGVISQFTGISTLTIGDRDGSGEFGVYFTADVDFDGTSSTSDDLEGGFRLIIPEPGTLGLLLMAGLLGVHRRR